MSIKRSGIFAAISALALVALAPLAEARTTGGGEIMTNEKVMALVEARISPELVIRMIRNASRTRFDVTSEGVLQLTRAGVSEEVISAMMDIFQKEIAEHDRNVRIHIQMLRSDVIEEYDRAVRELLRYGPYAVPLLIEHSTNDDERVRAGCMEVLGRIADPASIDAIFQSLLDRNQAVRARAARAASMFAPEVVGSKLAAGLDRRSAVRDGYALALGYLGETKYLPLLLKLADGTGSETDRAAASYALGLLGEPRREVVKVLLKGVMDDTFRDLREASARALGGLAVRMPEAMRDEVAHAMARSVERYASGRDVLALQLRFLPSRRSVEVLLNNLSDRDRSVASSCWEALKAVTGEDLPQDVDQWRAWWQIASSQPRWRGHEEAPRPSEPVAVEATLEGEAPAAPAAEAESETEATVQPIDPNDPFWP